MHFIFIFVDDETISARKESPKKNGMYVQCYKPLYLSKCVIVDNPNKKADPLSKNSRPKGKGMYGL